MKKLLSLFTALTVALTMIIGTAVISVDAASPKYEVPVKAVSYYNDSAEGQPVWKQDSSESYKYNSKGNLIKKGKIKSTWKYKKKKAVKVTTGSKKTRARAVATYKKGKLKKATMTMYSKKGKSLGSGTETYKYKKGWITKITGKKGKAKYTFSYKYKFYANGMPKAITMKSKAYGTTFTNKFSFNDKGLLTGNKTEGIKETYSYQYDNMGRVVERIQYVDGDPMYRVVYTYNGTKTDKKTYFGIVNGFEVSGAVRDVVPSEFPMLAK